MRQGILVLKDNPRGLSWYVIQRLGKKGIARISYKKNEWKIDEVLERTKNIEKRIEEIFRKNIKWLVETKEKEFVVTLKLGKDKVF